MSKMLTIQRSTTTIGILGGMGPLASAQFLREVLDNIPAKKDWEYPRIILDSNPHIPSRSRAWLYNETSPLPGMIAACKKLEKYNVKFIALPCNSAQCWLEPLQHSIKTQIVDIRKITVDNLVRDFPSVKQAIVFGSAVTLGTDGYKQYLENAGLEYIKPDADYQKDIESFIELAKLNSSENQLKENFLRLLQKMEDKNCAVILACTEFGLLGKSLREITIPYVNSLSSYAKRCAELVNE